MERLRKLEKIRFHEALSAAKQLKYSIRGFYHISLWRKYYEDVIMDQLYLMAGKRSIMGDGHGGHLNKNAPADSDRGFTQSSEWASLLDAVDALHINVVGVKAQEDLDEIKKLVLIKMKGALTPEQKTKLLFTSNETMIRGTYKALAPQKKKELLNRGNISEGESSTLHRMWHYCKKQVALNRKAMIFYIHDKGTCCYPAAHWGAKRGPDDVAAAVDSWRNVMNTVTLEFPSVCLRAILGGYSTCGYGTQGGDSARAHFSGNFFYADCGHVAALPRIITFFDAWKTEFFIHRTSKWPLNRLHIMHRCAFEPYHCDLRNHYEEVCKRSSYIPRLESLINSSDPMPRLSSAISDHYYFETSKGMNVNLRKGYTDPGLLHRANNFAVNGAPRLTSECRPLFLNGTGKYQDQLFYYSRNYFME